MAAHWAAPKVVPSAVVMADPKAFLMVVWLVALKVLQSVAHLVEQAVAQ